jgi:hypothetical protein
MLYGEYYPEVKEDLQKQKYAWLSRIYAHGELQDLLEYDQLYTDSLLTYKQLQRLHYSNVDQIIINEKIKDNSNNEHDIIIYAWSDVNNFPMGLVVLTNDEEYKIDAEKKYKNMEQII